jgi:GAF domain-containing protein/HAMP domain-containing protein
MQLIAWLLALAAITLGLTTLFPNIRHTANRHTGALLLLLATNLLAVGALTGAADTRQATWPSVVLAATTVVQPALLIVTLILIKPEWLRERRWLRWLLYGLAALPAALTAIDVVLGTQLWYTGLDPATYTGGFVSLPEYVNGRMAVPIRIALIYLVTVATILPLAYVSLSDTQVARITRQLARVLLGVQITAIAIPIVFSQFIFSSAPTLLLSTLFVVGYAYAASRQMISERRLLTGRLQLRLTALILSITIPLVVAVWLVVGVVVQLPPPVRTGGGGGGAEPQVYAGFVIVLGAALLAILIRFTLRQAVRPIGALTTAASAVSRGDLAQSVPVESDDELGALTRSFNTMTLQLQERVGALELRIAARTAQLQTSAEVGRAATSILDPDELLRSVVQLIANRFDAYYVAVFGLDEAGKQAVLREASGEAGRLLKARGHALAVGGQSMVGTVTANRRPRIALDVDNEPVRFANPLLPNTRSEIALPLIVGDRVLGALDVQSTHEDAFDEASAAALQSMADHIAVALNNARQFQQAEQLLQTQSALLSAALEMSGQADRDGLIDLVLHRILELLDADGSGVWLPLGDAEIELVAAIDPGQVNTKQSPSVGGTKQSPSVGGMEQSPSVGERVGRRLARGEGLPGSVYASGIALRVDDYPTWPGRSARVDNGPCHAAVAVPLMWQGRVEGVLSATRSQPGRPFSADEERVAQLYAAQVAAALASVKLLEEQRRTLDELDTANRRLTGQAWSEYFGELPERVLQVDFARPGRAPVEQKWLPEVDLAVTSTMPVVWTQRQDQTVTSPFQAAIAAPIVLRGEVIGALQVGEADRPRLWSAEDLSFIQAVADQVALAVENARLIEQTQRVARRERAIAEAADKIHRPVDMDTILRTAVDEVSRITGSTDVSIQLGVAHTDSHG